MRAIIIQDTDAKALLDRLELVKLRPRYTETPASVDEIHRTFHFEVCRWLQEQGADVAR